MGISLDELAQKPYPVLFDTSVLIGYRKSKKPKAMKEQFAATNEYYEFLFLIKRHVEKGRNFYIPVKVSKELIERAKPDCELLELCKKINECNEEQCLIQAFRYNNKILQLNGQNLYDFLSEKYIKIKEEYKLSKTDFDFLISGIVLAKLGGSVGLVSNDSGIFGAGEHILEKEKNLWSKKVKFFVRKGFSDFERKKISKGV